MAKSKTKGDRAENPTATPPKKAVKSGLVRATIRERDEDLLPESSEKGGKGEDSMDQG